MASNKELSEWLKAGIDAVLQASNIILEIYNSDFAVETKADFSPVTEADKKANEFIELKLSHFGFPFIGEEGEHPEYEQRKSFQRFWLLDPVDGTKEFVKRNGEFSVNLAFIENNEPILGIIYSPVMKDLYFACKGMGAFKIDRHLHIELGYLQDYSIEELIRKAKRMPIAANRKAYTVIASRSHLDETTKRWIKEKKNIYPDMETIYCGSSLKMCLVAEGKADVYPRFGYSCEWDTAAGQIIVEESGGLFLDYKSGQRLMYNKAQLVNPWFIVWSTTKQN